MKVLFENDRFNGQTDTFVTFAGRKKKRGYGYLLMAGAVLAGQSPFKDLEISR